MTFGIISIILGIVLVIGIIFYKKPKSGATDENPIHSTYRRGMEILSPILRWGIPIFLIGSGIYYYRTTDKESQLKEEAKEREIARQIHFGHLMDIVNTPMNEREMKILDLDFEPKGTNDFGREYNRDFGENIFELHETGTVRFLSKSKESYLRLFNEAKEDSFYFSEEVTNNTGDKFSHYLKGSYSSSFGYFTNSQTYLCALSDDEETIAVTRFLPVSFLIGSWGRVSILNEGKYTFYENKTFTFDDSREGRITGNWNTDKKTIIINYDRKIREYGLSHNLSMKTEIIRVTNKEINTLDEYLNDNEFITVTLSRQ